MGTQRLWHYTVGRRFDCIADEGVIIPATAGVPPGETPAVWFSFHQTWEPTATKGIFKDGVYSRMTKDEMITTGGGLVRIAVDPEAAPHSWLHFRNLSGIIPSRAKALARVGRIRGANPNDWRVSFEPVTRGKWTAIEEWQDGEWVPRSLKARRVYGGSYIVLATLPETSAVIIDKPKRNGPAVTTKKPKIYTFPAGHYLYVGSGQGPGGVQARAARHLRSEKVLTWNIDFFLAQTEGGHADAAWVSASKPEQNFECRWATRISQSTCASVPVPRFGASDCKAGCPAHLFHFKERPLLSWVRTVLWVDGLDLHELLP